MFSFMYDTFYIHAAKTKALQTFRPNVFSDTWVIKPPTNAKYVRNSFKSTPWGDYYDPDSIILTLYGDITLFSTHLDLSCTPPPLRNSCFSFDSAPAICTRSSQSAFIWFAKEIDNYKTNSSNSLNRWSCTCTYVFNKYVLHCVIE